MPTDDEKNVLTRGVTQAGQQHLQSAASNGGGHPRDVVDVLWCPNQRQRRGNGWSFPPAVEKHLRALTAGQRVCQLFGGRARWGTRIDIDPVVAPHVRADAYMPPFVKNAFDVVILDPPYVAINQQMKQQLLRGAAYIASDAVIWFHTQWIAGDAGMRLRRAWLVRVGDSCSVRCIQVFAVGHREKRKPLNYFTRGPAMKYNKWIAGQTGLPYGEGDNGPADQPLDVRGGQR